MLGVLSSGGEQQVRRRSSGYSQQGATASSLGISADQLQRLQHLAEQSSEDKTKPPEEAEDGGGGLLLPGFVPAYGSTLGDDLIAPPVYIPERRSSWAPEPRKNSINAADTSDVNSNQSSAFPRVKPPDITISTTTTLTTSHSTHNMSNYRRGSDVLVQRKLSGHDPANEDEEFDRACQQYLERDKRRRCSNAGMRRKTEAEIDTDLTKTNLILVTLFILALLSVVVGIKWMYF